MNYLNLLMDVEQVSNIVNITCTALFASILVILALCFLRGLLRGWKRGTYNLIFILILVTVALLTLNPIAKAIGTIDISFIGSPQTVTSGDVTFTFEVTTLQATIQDFFVQFFKASGYAASPKDIVSYSTALSYSVIKLVLILIDAILIFTLGLLFIFLMWHIAFKRFTPKDKRKKKSLRLVSAFEEVVVGGIALTMFLTPLTGLVNSMAYNADLDKKEADKNEYASLVYGVLESYKNSVFSNVFFSYAKQDGKQSLDTQLLNFLTETKVEDYSTSLVKEVGSAANLASTLVNSGFLSLLGGQELSWRLFFASSSIPTVLTYLADMDLVKVALPVVITILTNMDQTKSILGEDTVNYLSQSNVDWSKELKNLASIYTKLVDADLFQVLVEEESKTPIFDLSYLFDMFDNESNKVAFNEAIDFADTELSRHLIAGLMYSLCQKDENKKDSDPSTIQLVDFMPKNNEGNIDYSSFASFSWMNELKIVYDSFYSLVQINPVEMKEVFDCFGRIETSSSNRKNASGGAGSLISNQFSKKISNFLIDNIDKVTDPIIGDVTKVDGNGVSTSSNKCLLDSSLLSNALPEIVPMLENSLKGSTPGIDLSGAQASLTDTSYNKSIRGNFKNEFNSIFSVIKDFAKTTSGKAFIKDIDHMPGINFDPAGKLYSIDSDLVDALATGLSNIDNSLIVRELIPSYVDSLLSNNESLKEFFPSGINTRLSSLGSEVGKIIRLVGDCPNLIRLASNGSFSSLDSIMDFLKNNGDEMKLLLNTVCSSKLLFAPSTSEDDPGIDSSSIADFINNLTKGFKENLFTAEDIKNAKDSNGSLDNEIDAMVDVLIELAKSGVASSLSELGSSYSSSINTLSKLNIESTFSKIDESSLMKKMLSKVLDDGLNTILGEDRGNVSFENVTSWKEEGKAIQNIINLASKGLDLSSLDFFSSGELLTEMLKALAGSGIFVHEGEYIFPEFLYNKIVNSLDKTSLEYFADKGADLNTLSKEEATTVFKESLLQYKNDKDGFIGANGELNKICDVLKGISSLGGLDSLTDLTSDLSRIKLEKILKNIASSSTLGRVLLYNGMNKAISNLPSAEGIHFSKANCDFFYNEFTTAKQKEDEVRNVMNILSLVYDSGLIKDGSMDLSKLNIDSISVDFFLKPLLDGIKDSRILGVNSASVVASSDENEGTLFGDLILTLIDKSTLYDLSYYSNLEASKDDKVPALTKKNGLDEHINSHTTLTKVSIVNGVGVTSWDKEIESICDILKGLQDSPMLDGTNINTSLLSKPSDFFGYDNKEKSANRDNLEDLLTKISNSKLLGYALPNKIETILFRVGPDGQHFNVNHIVGNAAFKNDFLWASDPYFTRTVDGKNYERYSNVEINNLVDLFYNLSYCDGLDGNNLKSIDPTHLTKGLKAMSKTGVFNSKEGVREEDKTGTIYYEYTSPYGRLDVVKLFDENKMTCFQAVMSKFVDTDSLHDYLWNSANPGDTSYTSINDKVIGLVKNVFKNKYDSGNFIESDKKLDELSKFYSDLLNADEKDIFKSDNTIDFDNVSSEGLSALFKALNKCSFYQDVIPNAMYELFQGTTYEIPGIDLARANCFVKYKTSSNPGLSNEEWAGELDLICSILPLIRDNKTALANASKTLENLDPLLLRSLMYDFSESYVFHNNGDCLNEGTSGDLKDDLTVFEQLVYYIYDNSGLAEKAFSISSDGAKYLDSIGTNPKYTYKNKLHDRIISFTGSWMDEINHLTYGYDGTKEYGLIYDANRHQLLKKTGSSSNGPIDISKDTLKTLEPEKITDLFHDMNGLAIVEDALSDTLSDLLENTGLNDKSIIEFDMLNSTSYDFSDYYLEENTPSINRITFDSSNGKYSVKFITGEELNPVLTVNDLGSNKYEVITKDLRNPFTLEGVEGGVISNVHVYFDTAIYSLTREQLAKKDIAAIGSLLKDMYDPASHKYFDFNAKSTIDTTRNKDFRDFRHEGHSTKGIFDLLKDSTIYSGEFNFDGTSVKVGGDATKTTFASRGLVFDNILEVTVDFNETKVPVSLASNFDGANKYKKSEKITEIFGKSNMADEAKFFDEQIFSSSIFQAYLDTASTAADSATFATYNGVLGAIAKGNATDPTLKDVNIINYLKDFNNYDSNLGKELLAGQLDHYMELNVANINRYALGGGSLSNPLAARSSFISSTTFTSFKENNYAKLDEIALNGLSSMINLLYDLFDKTGSVKDYSYLGKIKDSNRHYVDLVYLGSIYDILATKGIYTANKNDMFDLNNPTNYFKDASGKVFSYSSVASIISAS